MPPIVPFCRMQFRDGSTLPRLPIWKRAIDLVCCVIALPFLVIGALVGAILMWLTSPGPLLFRQERVGYRGQRFYLFKFRTMHVSASTATHSEHFAKLVTSNRPMQKLDGKGDSRLIRGGRFLRASGMDELPQIINILRGEMTVVGPRPCIPYEYDLYNREQRRRLESLPGLTGLWQVSGKNQTSFAEMIELDVDYSHRMSLCLDLKIMLLTPGVLARQILASRMPRKPLVAEARPPATYAEAPFKPDAKRVNLTRG